MLSEKDKKFLARWEKDRDKEATFKAKLLHGLPMAALFSLPILLFILIVYLFLPDWYTRVSNRMEGSLVTIIIAVICCIIFFAYFRMHYKWEMNNQLYQELKNRENKTEDTN